MKTAAVLLLVVMGSLTMLEAAPAAAVAADSAEPSKLKKEAPFCENCKARPPSYLVGKRQDVLFPAAAWDLEQQQEQEEQVKASAPLPPALMLRELLMQLLRQRGRAEASLLRGGDDDQQQQQLFSYHVKEEVAKKALPVFCKECLARPPSGPEVPAGTGKSYSR